MTWPLVDKTDVPKMGAVQVRALVTGLEKECDEIDRMRPGASKDTRMVNLSEWLATVWPLIPEGYRTKALQAVSERRAA